MYRDILEKLTPESFEELCKELLVLDGFRNVTVHSKGPDGGVDLTAQRNYPIAHGKTHAISWLVQCKHTSAGKALTLDRMREILYDFETRDDFQGLIIITNAKLSAAARQKMRDLMTSRNRLIFDWDITDVESMLTKHPFLIEKFDLGKSSKTLPGASSVRVVVMSDGSVFSYHVFEELRRAGFDVHETRLHHAGSNAFDLGALALGSSFDVAYVFLGELFGFRIPTEIMSILEASIRRGLRCVFTPFCAWSVDAGVNPGLRHLLPVRARRSSVDVFRLLLPNPPDTGLSGLLPGYEDTFIENQVVSFEVEKGEIFSRDSVFEGRSTYEFLEVERWAREILTDRDGNPLICVGDLDKGRVAYLNMCAHNCMTPFPLRSPIEVSPEIATVISEFTLWFGKMSDSGSTQ